MTAAAASAAAAALPDEEHVTRKESFAALVERLSRQSVAKHYDAFADIDWDAPDMRLDATDPRFVLADEHALGRTAWYRAQPAATRAHIGLYVVCNMMEVGVQFENVLARGLLSFALTLPAAAPEFRYAYHEVIEESQHSLMFREFVRRARVDVPGMRGWRMAAGERIVKLGARFPELFFLFVLGGEDPIDHVQRTVLASGRDVHPLLERICRIHITEEARHLCFARQLLRERVGALSGPRRAALIAIAPVVLAIMARAMLDPPGELVARFGIPRDVVRAAWGASPEHRARIRDSLAKVRALCDELGLVYAPLWRRLGIA
jgi:P-aminobenzoate N-oxygenase AurF